MVMFMNSHPTEHCPKRLWENVAFFSGTYILADLSERVGDAIHNPHVADVPQSVVIALGVIASGVVTAIVDRSMHHPH
jgi:hypothetical protein